MDVCKLLWLGSPVLGNEFHVQPFQRRKSLHDTPEQRLRGTFSSSSPQMATPLADLFSLLHTCHLKRPQQQNCFSFPLCHPPRNMRFVTPLMAPFVTHKKCLREFSLLSTKCANVHEQSQLSQGLLWMSYLFVQLTSLLFHSKSRIYTLHCFTVK